MKVKTFEIPEGLTLHYLGPDIAWGELPTVFYFSIGGRASLSLDPFNQPAGFLRQFPMRVCSFDLPYHSEGENPLEAMQKWADDFANGKNPLEPFFQKVEKSFAYLFQENLIGEKLGFAGLSRGVFIAAHLAARIPQVSCLLGFSPLTTLGIDSLDMATLGSSLWNRKIRFYIGNNDTRVGTRNCFNCIEQFIHSALEQEVSSPSIEFIMQPSNGRHGHGTLKTTFEEGSLWLARQLGFIDDPA